jgi:glycosyltransferase involved in cell wall biosynthesis
MQQAVAVAHAAVGAAATVRVLAVLEATRLTGIARNVLDYARLAADGVAGTTAVVSLVLIRRGGVLAIDGLREVASRFRISAETVLERHRYDARVVDELRRIDAAVRPDIIETHHVKSHCLVALSGLWRERTWVAFHHGYTQTDLKVCAYNQIDRWSLRRAAHVVTTNEPFAAELTRRGVSPARLTVLHNGVRPMQAAPDALAAARRALGLHPGDRVILAIGRLSHEKGQAHLLRAFAQTGHARRGARVVLAGEGPDRPLLEALAGKLGIADRVVFAGYVPDVAPLYALADVFVLPSLTEGSPNALLEAMACGVPVVATTVGGVPEIARDGDTALLVPSLDDVAMGRAIDTLIGNRALAGRLGAAARQRVLRHHTPEQRVATLSNLYAALLSGEGQHCDRARF